VKYYTVSNVGEKYADTYPQNNTTRSNLISTKCHP